MYTRYKQASQSSDNITGNKRNTSENILIRNFMKIVFKFLHHSLVWIHKGGDTTDAYNFLLVYVPLRICCLIRLKTDLSTDHLILY